MKCRPIIAILRGIKPIENGADVVYGSRFKGSEAKRLIYLSKFLEFQLKFIISTDLSTLFS